MRGRKAFTLIELLVVIGIIAILASILFPVFAKAREAGRKTSCASNLHQVFLALEMYTQDYDEYYVPLYFGATTRTWCGSRQADGTFTPESGPLYPYLKNGQIRWCPSFSKWVSKGIYGNATGGYGYNDQFIGSSAYLDGNYLKVRPAHVSQVTDPVNTIVFADSAYWDMVSRQIEEKCNLSAPCYYKYGGAYDANIHFRHNNQANICYADGHVKARGWTSPGWGGGRDTSVFGLGFVAPVPVPRGVVPAAQRPYVDYWFELDKPTLQ